MRGNALVLTCTVAVIVLGLPGRGLSGSAQADQSADDSVQALLDTALTRTSVGDHGGAEAACREALQTFPDSEAKVRLTLGEVYLNQGRFAEAIGEAERAYGAAWESAAPGDLTWRAVDAKEAWAAAEGDFYQELAQLRRQVASDADASAVVRAECRIGDLLLGIGRSAEAAEQCWSVVRKYPWNTDGVLQAAGQLQGVYLQQGRRGAAPAAPLADWQARTLGRAVGQEAGEPSAIRSKCREIIATRPEWECEARLTLAEAWCLAGKPRRAQQEAMRALTLAATDPVRPRRLVEARRALERATLAREATPDASAAGLLEGADAALRSRIEELQNAASRARTMRGILESQMGIVDALSEGGLEGEAVRRCWEMLADRQGSDEAVWQIVHRLVPTYLEALPASTRAGGGEAASGPAVGADPLGRDRETVLALAGRCEELLTAGKGQEVALRLLLAELRYLLGDYASACAGARLAYVAAQDGPTEVADDLAAAALALLGAAEARERFHGQIASFDARIAAVSEPSELVDMRFELGRLQMRAGRPVDAVEQYAQVLTSGGAGELAAARSLRGMEEACAALGTTVPEGDQRFEADAALAEAVALQRRGWLLLAAEAAEEAAGAPGATYGAHLLLADLHYRLGQFERASHEAQKALRAADDSPSRPVRLLQAARVYVRSLEAQAKVDRPFSQILELVLADGTAAVCQKAVLDHGDRWGVAALAAETLRGVYAEADLPGMGRDGDELFEGTDELAPALDHMRAGRHDDAVRVCQQLLADGVPVAHEARLLLTEAYGRAGQLDDARAAAVAAFREAVASEVPARIVEAAEAVARVTDRMSVAASKDAVGSGGASAGAHAEGDAASYLDVLERLQEAGQSEMVLLVAFPRCRQLAAAQGAQGYDGAFGAFLRAALLLHRHISDAMTHTASEPAPTAQRLRDDADRLYRQGQGRTPKRPSDLAELPASDQEMLRLFERCLLLALDGRMIASWRRQAGDLREDDMKSAWAGYLMAQLLLTRDDAQMAEDVATLSEDMATVTVLAEFAARASQVGRKKAAAALYGEAAAKSEDPAVAAAALKRQADVFVELREVGRAIESYGRIARDYPQAPGAAGAKLQAAKLLASEWKSYGAAAEECKELRRLFPESAEAVEAEFLTGQFYYLDHSYDKAIEALEAALARHRRRKGTANAKLLLAMSHMGGQDTDRALTILGEIVAENVEPSAAARAQYLIGYVQLTQQEYAEALEAFRELKEMFPDSEEAAKAERLIERLDKAVTEVED